MDDHRTSEGTIRCRHSYGALEPHECPLCAEEFTEEELRESEAEAAREDRADESIRQAEAMREARE
jgi:hypothetical protein